MKRLSALSEWVMLIAAIVVMGLIALRAVDLISKRIDAQLKAREAPAQEVQR